MHCFGGRFADADRGLASQLSGQNVTIDDEAIQFLAQACEGDARRALSAVGDRSAECSVGHCGQSRCRCRNR